MPAAPALELVLCDEESDAERVAAAGEAPLVVVRDAASYLKARRRICDHLVGGALAGQAASEKTGGAVKNGAAFGAASALRVCVVGKRYWQWIADLRRLQEVTVRRESARDRVEEKWKASLPSSISSAEARALALLNLPPPPNGRSTAAHVLRHRLGAAWTEDASSAAHAARLLAETDDAERLATGDTADEDTSEETDSWLDTQRRERLRTWAARAPRSVCPFYRSLRADVGTARAVFCAGFFVLALRERARQEGHGDYTDALLQTLLYDYSLAAFAGDAASAQEALLEQVRRLRERADAPAARKIAEAGHTVVSGILLRHWLDRLRKLKVRDDAFVEAALVALPGHAAEEAHALRQVLRDERSEAILHADHSEEIEERYAVHSGAREALDALQRHVMPAVPAAPELAWSDASGLTDDWTAWLTDEYLPYRRALSQRPEKVGGEALRTLEARADAFSGWLLQHYPELLREGRDLVTSVGRAVAKRLDADERVVWLVWDNLPAHHEQRIAEAMRTHGFDRAAPTAWKLALLPSVTKTSFPASLSGVQPSEIEASSTEDYATLVEEQFSKYDTCFENSLSGMEEMLRRPRDLYVLHYRAYDRLLHQPEAHLEDRRENELDYRTDRIFERLAAAFDAMPSDRPCSLVISSDHGSTNLPSSAKKIPLPSGAEPAEEYSARAVEVGEDFDPEAPDAYDPDVCTPLDPNDFGLSGPVLLARGFRAWKTTRAGSGYVHGGALPEEVLVPLMQATRSPVSFAPLRLHHIGGELRRGEVKTLRIRLENRNDQPVGPVHLALSLGSRTLPRTPTVERVPSRGRHDVEVPVRLEPEDEIEDERASLRVVVAACFLGRDEHREEVLHVPARERAVRSQTGENLDDFFD